MRGRVVLAAVALALLIIAVGVFWTRPSGLAQASQAQAAPASIGRYAYLDRDGALFELGPARDATSARQDPDGAWERPIRISRRAALRSAQTGELTVQLPDGSRYPVRYERSENAPGGNWTLVGRVDTGLGTLAAVITYGPDGVFGLLPTPSGQMMQITTRAGRAYLQPAGGIVPVSTRGAAPVDYLVPTASPSPAAQGQAAGARRAPSDDRIGESGEPRISIAQAPAAIADTTTIKVLGVYTSNLVVLRGSDSAARTEFTNLLAIANQAHADSGSRVHLELVDFAVTDYPAEALNSAALDALTFNTLPDGTDIHALRNTVEADLVALVRPYAENDPTCGVAWMNGGGLSAHSTYSEFGYSVSAVDPCGPLVLAHELGHNLGSAHDIETQTASDGSVDYGAFKFSFGYRRYDPAFATVMAYQQSGQSWINRFSHPGTTLCAGGACGIEEQADNVRSINLMAESISRFRDPPNTVSIFDARAYEKDDERVELHFFVRLSSPAPSGGVTFRVEATGGTATNGIDFVFAGASGTIPEGGTIWYSKIELLPDTDREGDETILLELSDVQGMTLLHGHSVATILDDDPRVRVTGRIVLPEGSARYETLRVRMYYAKNGVYDEDSTSASWPDYHFELDAMPDVSAVLTADSPEPLIREYVRLKIGDADLQQDIELDQGVYLSGRVRWPEDTPAPTSLMHLEIRNWIEHGGLYGTFLSPPDFRYSVLVRPGANLRVTLLDAPAPYVDQKLEVGPIHADTVRDIELRDVSSLTTQQSVIREESTWGEATSYWHKQVNLSVPAPPGGVTFKIKATGGDAEPDDYDLIEGPHTIEEGSTFTTFAIGIVDDRQPEPDETIVLSIVDIQGAAWNPGPGSVTIIDDERSPSDFDGDGRSDLAWRNVATGQNAIWRSADATTQLPIGRVHNLDWRIIGSGDFDGDGTSDLLWRQAKTGANAIWKGGRADDQQPIARVAPAWHVAGLGDFNGNGTTDLLWRNGSTGVNTMWESADHTTPVHVAAVGSQAWEIAGAGDFDADGRSDVLWRNAQTGENAIWLHGDRGAQQAIASLAGPDWRVVGIGDFDGDAADDIVWRSDATGANRIWYAAEDQRTIARVGDQAWQVAAVGDYDGDGLADLLWRNREAGGNVVWLGGNIGDVIRLTAVRNLDWEVVP